MIKNIFALICVFTLILVTRVIAQDKSFRPTYAYKGYVVTDKDNKLEINMNFLILLDSTIVGFYYYSKNDGDLKLSGHLYANNKFTLIEWDKNDYATGSFSGILTKEYKGAVGKWKSSRGNKIFDFSLTEEKGKSYWYYIKKTDVYLSTKISIWLFNKKIRY